MDEDQLRFNFRLFFDGENDSKIPKGEFGLVSRALGANPTQKDIKTLVDNHASERLSFEDFLPMYSSLLESEKKRNPLESVDRISSGFRAFDREGDGNIGYTDCQNILEKLGEKMNREETEAILSMYADSEGKIAYEQMVAKILEAN